MRIALFFDGNNFYRSMDAFDPTIELDYNRLAAWVVDRVGQGQGELAGAYYYTGFVEQTGLDRFLKGLELCTGFFVRRQPVVERHSVCPHCQGDLHIRTEKRVDTRLVAEMIQLAAVGAFDRAVVFSGDEDLIPAVDAVRALGKSVYVASWGGRALSRDLRVRCFGHIDLSEEPEALSTGRRREREVDTTAAESEPLSDEAALLAQLHSACRYFQEREGQVSRWYFEQRWKPDGPCPEPGEPRHLALESLISDGQVEEFQTVVKGRMLNAIRPV
ncbi:MAG: uncharacterized LabA/DUF88 family protein [Myxococcota bacterium]|jgi:uncharacterized LabA/DUF88 family protein